MNWLRPLCRTEITQRLSHRKFLGYASAQGCVKPFGYVLSRSAAQQRREHRQYGTDFSICGRALEKAALLQARCLHAFCTASGPASLSAWPSAIHTERDRHGLLAQRQFCCPASTKDTRDALNHVPVVQLDMGIQCHTASQPVMIEGAPSLRAHWQVRLFNNGILNGTSACC